MAAAINWSVDVWKDVAVLARVVKFVQLAKKISMTNKNDSRAGWTLVVVAAMTVMSNMLSPPDPPLLFPGVPPLLALPRLDLLCCPNHVPCGGVPNGGLGVGLEAVPKPPTLGDV